MTRDHLKIVSLSCLLIGGCMVFAPALAQTADTTRPTLKYQPLKARQAQDAPPGVKAVDGNPGTSDFNGAGDAFAKAVAARGNGDMKTACTHATNAVKSVSRTKASESAHTLKMYIDLKAMVCVAKPAG